MRNRTALLLIGLVACALAVNGQKTEIFSKLENNGHKLAAAVLDIAGVKDAAQDPKSRYTFFLPTDAAVQTWLKDMGLTVDDLKKRPVLAKQLVGQHTLLGSNAREQEFFAKGETVKVASLASSAIRHRGDTDLIVKRTAPGKFTVTDPQGNVANIVGKPVHTDDNKTIIPIDRVLMGEEYYYNFEDACKGRKGRVSIFCDSVKTTGLDSVVKPSTDATIFVPNNDAFKKATAAAKPSNEQLTKILKYHVVPGAREVPAQWKDGTTAATALDNKPLKLVYDRKVEPKHPSGEYAEVSVIPADGQKVPILKPNVHVGKTVVHGIGSVLNPEAAAKPAATVTEKAAKPDAATTKPAATTATDKGAKPSGRKLLVGGGSGYGLTQQYAATAAQDAASSAIYAAVAGGGSASTAARVGLKSAEYVSTPGAWNAVMSGVDPW